jgi:hypothetical protein
MRGVIEERPDLASGRAFGRLDLDHLGAEAGEQKAAVLAELVGDFHDSEPREHPWSGGADHGAGPSPALTVGPLDRWTLDHFGADWESGEASASAPRPRGDRSDFHRADKLGAAAKVASTSNTPVMRLER